MNRSLLLLIAVAFSTQTCLEAAAQENRFIQLDGEWRFELDPQDAGIQQQWFVRTLADTVHLPGSLPAQGLGNEIAMDTDWTGGIVDRSWFTAPRYEPYRQPGNIKVPFWLQPTKHYVGPAWYQRAIEIPPGWRGKRIQLEAERPHWETRLWVDNSFVGSNNSLATPHLFDLGLIEPGTHSLTIRVDNRLVVDVGENSHSVTDHTQGNWNGIAGAIRLQATAPVWIDHLRVTPHLETRTVTVQGQIGNASRRPGKGTLGLRASKAVERGTFEPPFTHTEATWTAEGGLFEVQLPVPDAEPWDEFNPALFNLEARLDNGEWKATSFGFRDISTSGTQFLINGRKTFFRGTLECAIFPESGHPPTDIDSWRRIIRIAKAHGLNLIRFHSWCPPEAAFVAADELGFYFQVECSSWANQSTTLGDGKSVDEWIYHEADRILRAYGNHPSFLLMAYGNEPGGRKYQEYLSRWLTHYRAQDPRRLYTGGSGWPELPENQFHVVPDPRIQAWGAGLASRINARPPETRTDYRPFIRARSVPVISHEIGQWCVYPNFEEIPKYTGYLKPRNFEIFRDFLRQNHMGHLARQFLMASGKLQTLCYKEEIESALRTPGMGGFQLLDLHDFPGQGTALVGVLDPFWDSKGYVSAEEYRRFCNSTVLLARLGKRVFTPDDFFDADLEVAHFGPKPLNDALVEWKIINDKGRAWAGGHFGRRTIPVDNGTVIGNLNLELKSLPVPGRYKLVAGLRGTDIENDWDFWGYPVAPSLAPPPDVTVASELDRQALAALDAGGKVLLCIPSERVKGDEHGRVALGFSSIFWNTAWTSRQPPHTLGLLVDPQHPLFEAFPTDYHSNWQWWYLVSRAGAMILDDLPPDLSPLVRVIDDWFTARRLALLFEARVGNGRLVICSIELENLAGNVVARQFRHSLLRYMSGPRFKPGILLTPDQVRGLFASRSTEKLERSK